LLQPSVITLIEVLIHPMRDSKPVFRGTRLRLKRYPLAEGKEATFYAAEKLFKKGIKSKDALHVACAIELNCDFFITTDKAIIKKLTNFESIKVISPVDFINDL
jgi:predicted nucleic acid-binding protein